MTREEIAAMAMQALAADIQHYRPGWFKSIAKNAVLLADALIEELEKTKKGGWIKWSGGERPVSYDTFVKYRVRIIGDGPEYCGPLQAGQLRWDHRNHPGDIIEYMVVKL